MTTAYLFFLVFFAVLGALHGSEEIVVRGKKYRACPVYPALVITAVFTLLVASLAPQLGALVAAALEPRAFRVNIRENETGTSFEVYAGVPQKGGETYIHWLYWVYTAVATLGPFTCYYCGYNFASRLRGFDTVSFLESLGKEVEVIEVGEGEYTAVETVTVRKARPRREYTAAVPRIEEEENVIMKAGEEL